MEKVIQLQATLKRYKVVSMEGSKDKTLFLVDIEKQGCWKEIEVDDILWREEKLEVVH